MLMLVYIERTAAKSGKAEDEAIAWIREGKSFEIRDKDRLTSTWLPLFFSHAKYSSFTRKLYRWGFRKLNALGSSQPMVVFSNENFQRDNPSLVNNMRSTTAAKLRNELLSQTEGSVMHAGHMMGTPAQFAQLQAFQQVYGPNPAALAQQQQAMVASAAAGGANPKDNSQYLMALSRLLPSINNILGQQQMAQFQQQNQGQGGPNSQQAQLMFQQQWQFQQWQAQQAQMMQQQQQQTNSGQSNQGDDNSKANQEDVATETVGPGQSESHNGNESARDENYDKVNKKRNKKRQTRSDRNNLRGVGGMMVRGGRKGNNS